MSQLRETVSDDAAGRDLPAGVTPPSGRGGRFLSDVIVALGFAEQEAVDQALEASRAPGKKLGATLVEMGVLTEQELGRAVAERYRLDYLDLREFEIDHEAVQALGETEMRRYDSVPVAFTEDGALVVAMLDPADWLAAEEIAQLTGRRIRRAVASPSAISELIARVAESKATDAQQDQGDATDDGAGQVPVRLALRPVVRRLDDPSADGASERAEAPDTMDAPASPDPGESASNDEDAALAADTDAAEDADEALVEGESDHAEGDASGPDAAVAERDDADDSSAADAADGDAADADTAEGDASAAESSPSSAGTDVSDADGPPAAASPDESAPAVPVTTGATPDASSAELVRARSELESARGELTSTRNELKSARGELTSMRAELTSARGRLDAANKSAADAEQQLGELRTQVGRLEAELAAARKESDGLREDLTWARGQIEQVGAREDQALADLRARIEEIQGLRLIEPEPQPEAPSETEPEPQTETEPEAATDSPSVEREGSPATDASDPSATAAPAEAEAPPESSEEAVVQAEASPNGHPGPDVLEDDHAGTARVRGLKRLIAAVRGL